MQGIMLVLDGEARFNIHRGKEGENRFNGMRSPSNKQGPKKSRLEMDTFLIPKNLGTQQGKSTGLRK